MEQIEKSKATSQKEPTEQSQKQITEQTKKPLVREQRVARGYHWDERINININNHQPTNNNGHPLDKLDGSQTSQPKKPISDARLRANRQNAKKSTGPKTARGKGYSRRNAVKHGLLLKRLLFSDDGEPINEELHDLYDNLHERYGNGNGDIRTHLLVEGSWSNIGVNVWP